MLSVEYVKEDIQATLPEAIFGRAALFGRVVGSNQIGVNGLRVNLVSSGRIVGNTWTGSLQNLSGNILDSSKFDGWYFIPNIEPGVYDLNFT